MHSTRPPPQIISHKQAQNHDGAFKFAFAAENGLAHGEVITPDGSRNGGYTYIDPHGKKISVKYTAGKDGFRIIEGDHVPRPPPGTPQAAPHSAPPPAPHAATHVAPYLSAHSVPHQVPHAAPHSAPQQQYQQHQYQPAYSHYQQRNDNDDDGQYRPEKYERPSPPVYHQYQAPQPAAPIHRPAPVYQPVALHTPTPQREVHHPVPQKASYTIPQHKYETRSNQLEEEKEPEYNDEPGKPYSFGKGYFFEFGG